MEWKFTTSDFKVSLEIPDRTRVCQLNRLSSRAGWERVGVRDGRDGAFGKGRDGGRVGERRETE